VVAGLGGTSSELPLLDALDAIRRMRLRRVTLVLPCPGDPLGLRDNSEFARTTILAGAGVAIDVGHDAFGLVPEHDRRGSSYAGIRWRAHPGGAETPPLTVDPDRLVEQADRALRRALRAATEILAGVDLAHWRAEATAGRHEVDLAMRAHRRAFPPDWPAPARELGNRALALAGALRVAASDPGAMSASGSLTRAQTLRDLSRAVREALTTAYNVPAAALLDRTR